MGNHGDWGSATKLTGLQCIKLEDSFCRRTVLPSVLWRLHWHRCFWSAFVLKRGGVTQCSADYCFRETVHWKAPESGKI